jgi:hypothetical protein
VPTEILISVKSAAPEIVHRTADQPIERPGARVNLILKLAIRKRNHVIQEVVLIAACDEIDVATLHLGCKWLSPYLLGPCDLVGVDLEAAEVSDRALSALFATASGLLLDAYLVGSCARPTTEEKIASVDAPFLKKVSPELLTVIDRSVRLQGRGRFPVDKR